MHTDRLGYKACIYIIQFNPPKPEVGVTLTWQVRKQV